jgi:Carboxypeptidase regulatory-like domain
MLTRLLVIPVFLTSCVLFAQTAELSGFVKDPGGATVPNASVEARNQDTGVREKSVTNQQGLYALVGLRPGVYQLTVQAPGFKTLTRDHVVLEVAQRARLDMSLELGTVQEKVTVQGNAALLNSTDGSVSTVVDRGFIANLPLNGRSYQNLMQLTPGVVVATTSFYDQGQFNVNGQRGDANYYTVDGVSANFSINAGPLGQSGGGALPALTAGGGFNGLASVDDVQEFRIQTSTFSPEYGRTPGAQVSISTRSGTNEFHGTAFDYFRNDKLDANDWFANQQSQPRPAERQNDFGGVVGGPIVRDRTFFFFSYEGLRLRLPQVAISEVPDTVMRTTAPAVLQPILNAFPIQNGPELGGDLAQFAASFSNPTTLNATSIRVDHLMGKLSLFGRFDDAPSSSVTRGGSPLPLSELTPVQFDTLTATGGGTWLISPTVDDEFRFNYSRSHGYSHLYTDNFGGAVPVDNSLIFPSFASLQNSAFLFDCCSNAAYLFVGANAINLQAQYNTVDNLSVTWGKHQFKFGVDQRRLVPTFGRRAYDSEYIYANAAGVLANSAASVYVDNAAGVANLQVATDNYSVYAQDTWRIGSRLTLTYGLRWEYNTAPVALNRQAPWTVTQATNLATMQLAPEGSPMWHASALNLAPRLGFAYQISNSHDWGTVFRGGSGIFYDLGYGQLGDVFAINSQYYGTTLLTGGTPFPLSTSQAEPPPLAGTTPPISQIAIYDPNLKLPYTIQWNGTIEQRLGAAQTLTVSYVGAGGRRLLRQDRYSKPNANFTTVFLTHNVASSSYNALQMEFRRQLTHGLQALASYTWSHSIDNASSDSYTSTEAVGRAASNFDIRHMVSGALSYDIPTPQWNALSKAVLGGWAVDSMNMARTAEPLTVIGSTTYINGVYVNALPNIVPGQPFYLSNPDVAGGVRINPAAFTLAPSGTEGTAPRNFLRAFGAWQSDLAIRRQFALTERLKLQFRGEFFNIFNHPNFSAPINTVTNALFGISTAMLNHGLGGGGNNGGFASLYQIGGPRSVEVAMKLIF